MKKRLELFIDMSKCATSDDLADAIRDVADEFAARGFPEDEAGNIESMGEPIGFWEAT